MLNQFKDTEHTTDTIYTLTAVGAANFNYWPSLTGDDKAKEGDTVITLEDCFNPWCNLVKSESTYKGSVACSTKSFKETEHLYDSQRYACEG